MRYSRKDLLQLPDHHLEFDERIEFDEDTYKKFPRIRKLRNVNHFCKVNSLNSFKKKNKRKTANIAE